jgi:putative endonuclease
MSARDKKTAQRFGKLAEHLSCWTLRLAGYRILQRGFQAAGGEIDIIARRGKIIAFIEVKARATLDQAVHALGIAQRRRIERTALAYLAQNPELANCDARFDLMALAPRSWPRHKAGAWMLGE